MNKIWDAGEPIWTVGWLRLYPIMILLGVLLSFASIAYFWKRQKYSWEHLQIILILAIPCAIFGARIYTCIFDGGWDQFWTFAGLSIYGGVIGGALPVLIYLYFVRHSLDFRTVIGIILPAILIGQVAGRWGNFTNHEIYGRIVHDGSSLDWTTFIKPHMYIRDSDGIVAFRQPLFLYESLLNLFGYIVIVWVLLDRNILKPGVTGVLYLVYYGVVRLVLQIFRDSDPMNTSYIFGHVSLNLVVSAILIVFGFVVAIWWQFIGVIVSKKYSNIPSKKYEIIRPSKEVRRFFVFNFSIGKFTFFKKRRRVFKIYIPLLVEKRWSKREINRGKQS